jgi:pyruvate kinase
VSFIKRNRTKIVCTIGPASQNEEVLRQLILEGMDVARLNFSHGTHEYHKETLDKVRRINADLGNCHVAILVDLQGPKIRIGALAEPFPIATGDEVVFCTSITERDGNRLPVQYQTLAKDVREGDLVLVDDGKVYLTVLETNSIDTVRLRVDHGEAIGSKKGINLPMTDISMPSISEKDWHDVEFAIRERVDWVALSFVRSAAEVRELQAHLRAHNAPARVMAKIEKPEALKNIDEIIEAADGIMVARGDLGVEIHLEEVPLWQKIIVQKCNVAAKPVIVATQMMESMIENRRPTRAETTDVANAVVDGADALMLSGETASGKFPVETVTSMQRIIAFMEEQDSIYYKNLQADPASPTYLSDCVVVSACELARKTNANAIVGMTVSGYTGFHLAKCRPKAHIHIFTPDKEMLAILNLVWGVRAHHYDRYTSTDETFKDLKDILLAEKHIRKGDILINTASMPIQERHRTNMVKISVVD